MPFYVQEANCCSCEFLIVNLISHFRPGTWTLTGVTKLPRKLPRHCLRGAFGNFRSYHGGWKDDPPHTSAQGPVSSELWHFSALSIGQVPWTIHRHVPTGYLGGITGDLAVFIDAHVDKGLWGIRRGERACSVLRNLYGKSKIKFELVYTDLVNFQIIQKSKINWKWINKEI